MFKEIFNLIFFIPKFRYEGQLKGTYPCSFVIGNCFSGRDHNS